MSDLKHLTNASQCPKDSFEWISQVETAEDVNIFWEEEIMPEEEEEDIEQMHVPEKRSEAFKAKFCNKDGEVEYPIIQRGQPLSLQTLRTYTVWSKPFQNQLQELFIEFHCYCQPEDLSFLKDVPQLKKLTVIQEDDPGYCNPYEMKLTGIEHLKQLEHFHMTSWYAPDWSPLQHCQNLKFLYLMMNPSGKADDFSCLHHLKNLETFGLVNSIGTTPVTPICGLKGLDGLTRLKEVRLQALKIPLHLTGPIESWYHYVPEQGPLPHTLKFFQGKASVKDLLACPSIEQVILSTEDTHFSDLHQLTKIQDMDLTLCSSHASLQGLQHCKHIKRLDLSYCKLPHDTHCLPTSLTHFEVHRYNKAEPFPLEDVSQLIHLKAFHAYESDPLPLKNCLDLRELSVDTYTPSLLQLKQVKRLKIPKLTPEQALTLTHIEELEVKGMMKSEVTWANDLPNLKKIFVTIWSTRRKEDDPEFRSNLEVGYAPHMMNIRLWH